MTISKIFAIKINIFLSEARQLQSSKCFQRYITIVSGKLSVNKEYNNYEKCKFDVLGNQLNRKYETPWK